MTRGASSGEPRLALPLRLLLALAAGRISVGVAGVAVVRLLGLSPRSAAVGAAVGAGLTLFAVAAPGGRQRPAQFPRLPPPEPRPFWRELASAMYPSTYGVATLTAIALAVNLTLAAVLAGVLLGLGLAALLYVL